MSRRLRILTALILSVNLASRLLETGRHQDIHLNSQPAPDISYFHSNPLVEHSSRLGL